MAKAWIPIPFRLKPYYLLTHGLKPGYPVTTAYTSLKTEFVLEEYNFSKS
jgi:hypothetical protein